MKNKQRVELKSFNNLNSNEIKVKNFYNYLPTEKLNNSYGVKIATFPLSNGAEYSLKLNNTTIEGLAYFKQYFSHNGLTTHRLLVYGGDNKVYINQMLEQQKDLFWLYSLTFNTAPITLAYKKDDSNAIILASKDEMKIWKTNYSPYTISNVPIITSMCMNEGVLFCTIVDPAFKIWYASDLDAEKIGNINSYSGYISLEDELGYARKILTFKESVYVFRDYGISKINYIKGNVSVNQVYLSNTKIYSDTIAVCGNEILFLTNDGIYSFNGVKVNKLDISLINLDIDCSKSVAATLGDKYYLALKINFNDDEIVLCEQGDYINNAIIVIDVENNLVQILRGIDVKSFLPLKADGLEKMLLTFNSEYTDEIGEIVKESVSVENNLPKLWQSDYLTDNNIIKLFTKLCVVADKDVKFKLLYDNKQISFTTYKQGINEFAFKISCKQIKLEISSISKSAEVESVSLDYYLC